MQVSSAVAFVPLRLGCHCLSHNLLQNKIRTDSLRAGNRADPGLEDASDRLARGAYPHPAEYRTLAGASELVHAFDGGIRVFDKKRF